MNVRSTARRLRARLLIGLLTSAMLLSASCSFESGASGLECDQEGATRDGEVCRDGYWRIVDEDGLDANASFDVKGGDDGGQDAQTDAPEDPDGCTPRSDEEICGDSGTCTDALAVTNRCTGAERTVDCTQFFDFDTDPLHCGGCDMACSDAGPNATSTCSEGVCGLACEAGWVDANGDAADGCEAQCTETNGGVEICDGKDNDCDGEVDGADATDAQDYFRDADADGYGDPLESTRACSAPNGYVDDDTDCDDTDDTTNPGADEVCDGAVDNNCDQTVDEQCPCTNGQTRPCGTDEGVCEQGTQTCANGQWLQECQGAVGADAEVCDGFDNDCDGQTDEDFADKGSTCTVGQGECENSGTYICTQDGTGVECGVSALSPGTEICDGLDNDCDGQADEDFGDKGTSCTVGQGECAATGTFVCTQDGSGTECDAMAGTPEASETCGDGLDNDCNGLVDDGCSCDYNGDSDGVCADGIPNSNGGCDAPATYETQEGSCDGLDNDCDGQVDEWVRSYLYPDADGDGYGDSSGGARVCPGTDGWVQDNGDCDDGDPNTYPGAQEICDGKDNNCNYIERDDGGNDASSWCSRYISGDNIYCGGPDSGVSNLCCEISDDGDLGCDFESVCDNNIDEDGDGATDCADSDCDGLSCASGKTCQSGSCQDI